MCHHHCEFCLQPTFETQVVHESSLKTDEHLPFPQDRKFGTWEKSKFYWQAKQSNLCANWLLSVQLIQVDLHAMPPTCSGVSSRCNDRNCLPCLPLFPFGEGFPISCIYELTVKHVNIYLTTTSSGISILENYLLWCKQLLPTLFCHRILCYNQPYVSNSKNIQDYADLPALSSTLIEPVARKSF